MKYYRFFIVFLVLTFVFSTVYAQTIRDYAEVIRRHCYADYKQMYREGGEGAFVYPFIVPGSKAYSRVLWDWDSWLSDMALQQILKDVGSKADCDEAMKYEQGCVLNYLYYTDSDGYMPMVVDGKTDPRMIKPADFRNTNMHKPVIAQHAALITRQTGGDATWLNKDFDGYNRIKLFLKNYAANHRHEATGLYYWQDDLAIGVDNDPSTFFRPKKSSGSIYLNCLMYKELRDMAYLAAQLKQTDDVAYYNAQADSLKQAVQEYCWDERDGMYYSVDLNLRPVTNKEEIIFGHKMILHKDAPRDYPCIIQRFGVWSGFMVLWAGIATPEQAKRIVAENYYDKRTFNAQYGIRTLSKLEKMYNLKATHNPSNWQGPIWGVSNYLVFQGLANYGFVAEAQEMAEKTIMLFGRDIKNNGSLHEYYNPDTGEGIINPGFQNWNYLVLNMIEWYYANCP